MLCCSSGNDEEQRTASDDEYYGEALKYDKNFKGPLSKRSCTDVLCLLIFIVFLGCWGFVGHYAIKKGDLDRLLVPIDTEGRKCGIDNGVVDKPYLVFFNLEKCIDPTVPLYGCRTPQVCVQKCPTTSFVYNEYQCNEGKINQIKSQLICKMGVDLSLVTSCAEITGLIQREECARWYLQSSSFLKRCISGLPKSECPYIPKRYLQQIRSRHSRSISHAQNDFTGHTLTKRSPFQFPDGSSSVLSQVAANEPTVQCEERNLLGTQILIEKGQHVDSMLSRFVGNFIMIFSNQTSSQEMGQMIVEDVMETWWYILIGLFLAMISCLLLIAIMRWVAKPLVWLSILGVIGMLGFGTYYAFKRFLYLRKYYNEPRETQVGYNLSKLADSWLQKPNTWLYGGIVLAVLLIIILLVVLVLRKRIVIAIALVKEGSKAVSSTTSTVFFPIFPWIFQLMVTVFAIAIFLHLSSVGVPVNQILRMKNDTNCICAGPAADYMRDGDPCDPNIFNQYCHDTSRASLSIFNSAPTTKTCKIAACNFKEIKSPVEVPYFQVLNVFGFFWGVFFITALGEMVLAATFATWYWTFHKSDVPFFTLSVGLGRTVRYHLGTIAFGSLIITICRMIRVCLEYLDEKLKKWDNDVAKCLLCCCKCFFWCLEKFLRFMSKNAYIMCAIHGKPFCSSAQDAFNLLMRNFLRVVALDKVTEFLFFLTKILVTVGMGAATYLYFTNEKFISGVQLHYVQVPVAIVMIGTYLIASVFFSVYSMAVDTLFLCFLEDCERNDGSEEKPYFMSKQLMKILGKKNLTPRDQYQ